MKKSKNSRNLKMESSPSGSLKRSCVANAIQKMSYLVDGCKSDPGKYREYYRRHRVCERHSKDPVVIVRSEEQRFCQKCSRFHGLGEFDEEKRSCRKRLDGHNKRRRKSRPNPFLGSTILQFSYPPMHGSPAMVYHSYEHLSLVHRLRSANTLACINHGESRQVNVLLKNDHERISQVTSVVSAHRQPADLLASSGPRGSQKIHPNGIYRSKNSYRAHSLLSPFISMRSNGIHSIAPVSSSHTHMIEPSRSTMIHDCRQVSPTCGGNTTPQVSPDVLVDNPGLDYI